MSISEHFDVVVLGGTLSATLVSSLLSERRYRGVLVDQGELSRTPPGVFSDLVMVDNASQIMQFIHSELRINGRIGRRSESYEAFLQVIYPDERIDVLNRRPEFLREFRRGFGDESHRDMGELLEQFDALEEMSSCMLSDIGVLPCTGFLAKRAAAATARRYKLLQASAEEQGLTPRLPIEVTELLFGLLPFITYLDGRKADAVKLIHLVRPFLRLLRGAARLEAGKDLRNVFVEHAKRGGFSLYRDAVERMEPKGRRHILSLTESQKQISCDYVIDASSDLSGISALPQKKLRRLAQTVQDARPKGALHALSFEVDKRVVPKGMSENVLLLNGRKKTRDLGQVAVEDRPILLICRPSIEASNPLTEGKDKNKRVRLIALHPLSTAESQVINEIDNVIRARIQRLIPFLDQGQPRRSESWFESGQKRVSSSFLLSHPLYDADVDETWGITGISNTTPIKSVLVAGPAVIPGLGVEGEYLSSLQACDELDRRCRGKKWPKTLAKRIKLTRYN